MKHFRAADVVAFMEAASEYWEDGRFTLGTDVGLTAVAPTIAARAVRQAARDLDGSDPSVDPVVQWLLARAREIDNGR